MRLNKVTMLVSGTNISAFIHHAPWTTSSVIYLSALIIPQLWPCIPVIHTWISGFPGSLATCSNSFRTQNLTHNNSAQGLCKWPYWSLGEMRESMAGSANYISRDQINSPKQMVYYRWINGYHFMLKEQHINRTKSSALQRESPQNLQLSQWFLNKAQVILSRRNLFHLHVHWPEEKPVRAKLPER